MYVKELNKTFTVQVNMNYDTNKVLIYLNEINMENLTIANTTEFDITEELKTKVPFNVGEISASVIVKDKDCHYIVAEMFSDDFNLASKVYLKAYLNDSNEIQFKFALNGGADFDKKFAEFKGLEPGTCFYTDEVGSYYYNKRMHYQTILGMGSAEGVDSEFNEPISVKIDNTPYDLNTENKSIIRAINELVIKIDALTARLEHLESTKTE